MNQFTNKIAYTCSWSVDDIDGPLAFSLFSARLYRGENKKGIESLPILEHIDDFNTVWLFVLLNKGIFNKTK